MSDNQRRDLIANAIENSKPASEPEDIVQREELDRLKQQKLAETRAASQSVSLPTETEPVVSDLVAQWAEKLGVQVQKMKPHKTKSETPIPTGVQKQIDSLFGTTKEPIPETNENERVIPMKKVHDSKSRKDPPPSIESAATQTAEMEVIPANTGIAVSIENDKSEVAADVDVTEKTAEVKLPKKVKNKKPEINTNDSRLVLTYPLRDCLRCRHLMPDVPSKFYPDVSVVDGKKLANPVEVEVKFGKPMTCLDRFDCPAQQVCFEFDPFDETQIAEAVDEVITSGLTEKLDALYSQAQELSANAHDKLRERVNKMMRQKLAD